MLDHEFVGLRDWVVAIAIMAGTFIIAPMVRATLAKLKLEDHRFHKRARFFGELAGPISFMIYPIALRIAIIETPLRDKATHIGFHAIHILFILAFTNLLRSAAMVAIRFAAQKGQNSETFESGFIPLLRNIVTVITFLVSGIMILKYLGYDVMSLVTALGVGSLAVGLAAQATLSNMISGFTLIIDRNLRPGDKINLGGLVGTVQDMGLRSTRLNMGDGNILIVPNQDLVNTKILNMSLLGPGCSCSAKFRVSLDTPFEKMKDVCDSIVKELPDAWQDKGTNLQLASVNSGQQELAFSFWVKDQANADSCVSHFHQLLVKRTAASGLTLIGAPV